MMRTAALVGLSRAVVSRCSVVALDATAWTTAVNASAYGVDAATRCCALTMRDAAMSSIALVIFLVDCTDLIRRRKTRCWAPTGYLLTVCRSGKNTCWYGLSPPGYSPAAWPPSSAGLGL